MFEEGPVSESPNENIGGMLESNEDWMQSSNIVAHSLLGISIFITDIFSKFLGSRWNPICIAVLIREPAEIHTIVE